MILPGKHLRQDRALLGVGAEILSQIEEGKTVSELWESVRKSRLRSSAASALPYDWFVLSLSFLYAITAVDFEDGIVRVRAKLP